MKVVVPVGSHKKERKEGKRVFFVILLAIRSHVSCKSYVSAWHRGRVRVSARATLSVQAWPMVRGASIGQVHSRALSSFFSLTDSKRLQAAS